MAAPEILFTGSVPLQPATTVFEALQRHCGQRLRRMPDGEQLNWVFGEWNVLSAHPAVEVRESNTIATSADTPFGGLRSPVFVLREGVSPQDVRVDNFGMADAIKESYRQLTDLKRRGVVPEAVRLQATMAGPGTTGGTFLLSWEDVVTIVNPPLIAEVEAITKAVPSHELAVQIDIAGEIEIEELRRNPRGFDVPVIAHLD